MGDDAGLVKELMGVIRAKACHFRRTQKVLPGVAGTEEMRHGASWKVLATGLLSGADSAARVEESSCGQFE